MNAVGLKRARKLLAAVVQAMPFADEIHESVSEWTDTYEAPPLLKQHHSWSEAVDPAQLEQFRTLVHFLSESIFGVDCDNDSAIKVVVIDNSREQTPAPTFRVPKVHQESTLGEIVKALELARVNAASSQELVAQLERSLGWKLKALIKREERETRAQACKQCRGLGWIAVDDASWRKLEYEHRRVLLTELGGDLRDLCSSCQKSE